jgi:hypothetical protein
VVHFVYVAKHPSFDNFLPRGDPPLRDSVVNTASLNKYTDVLIELLEPHRQPSAWEVLTLKQAAVSVDCSD